MPSQVDLFPAFESVAAPPRPTRQSVAPEQQITAETFWGNLDFHAFTADEAKKNKGRLGRCTYEFESAGTLNRNRRIYPEAVFKVAVDGLRPEVDARRVLGRLDHPDPWDPDSLIVTVRDGAVLIQSVEMVSDTRVRVVADVLDNPHGRQLISVIEAGGNPGISQRGWASWRDATDDERARYGIPKGQYVAVADTLRLITYDIVSSPGFNDADKPAVTEGKGAVDMSDLSNITLEQLKAGNPQIAQKLIAEGRAAASGELEQRVAAAVEAKKPELVAEANKAAEAKVAEANAQREKAVKALEAMKPALVELGVVNEKITDAEAAGKIATLEAKVTQLTEAVADRDGKIKALTDAMEKATLETTRVRAIEQVSQTYRQSHPKLHDLIVTEVGENTGWKTAEEALAIAKRTCDLLSKVPGAGQGAPAGETQQPFYKRFLTNPTASAEAASGGGQPSQGGSDQSLAIEQFLGMPTGAF